MTRQATIADVLEDRARWCVVEGDAWEVLASLPAAAVDHVICDPPYDAKTHAHAVTTSVAIMHRKGHGKSRWNGGGKAGIWRHMTPRGAERPDHPTPKPISLMVELLEDFTDAGEIVLDPFGGSGTTGIAALRTGRRVVLVERDPVYAELCRTRLEVEDAGGTLRGHMEGQRSLFG